MRWIGFAILLLLGHISASAQAEPVAADAVPPGFSVSGEWIFSNLPGHLPGKPTIYSKDPKAAAYWNPQLKAPGRVRISLFTPAHPGNDPQAKVAIFHAGTVDERRVDQTKEPPGWVELGEFEFAGKGTEYVRLSRGARGYVRAAAVKFEFVQPDRDNLWPNLIMDDIRIYDQTKLATKPVPLTDIKGHWAEKEIRAVVSKGILPGVSATRFGPTTAVAEPEVREVLEKVLGKSGKGLPEALNVPEGRLSGTRLVSVFVDAARASGKNLQWAKPSGKSAIAMAGALGFIGAAEHNRFQTYGATRAQLAALSARFQQNIVQSGPPTSGQWELTFDDEFNGQDLDWRVWKSHEGDKTPLSIRLRQNVVVSDGLLRLVTRKENRGGKEWTCASISTSGFHQTYGYWESRFRYAGASGLNNAFWIIPDRNARFEIDVNEGHFPNVVNSTLHQEGLPGSSTRYLATEDLSRDFHVYGVDWNAHEIIFYFDGREIGRKPNVKAHSPAPVVYSTAGLGGWAGPLTNALHGKSMDVDWVRAYRPKDK